MEEIREGIRLRDEADANRYDSPLGLLEGAILLDTSHLGVQEVVDRLSDKVDNLLKAGSSNSERNFEIANLSAICYSLAFHMARSQK